jgi:uncharacterized protein
VIYQVWIINKLNMKNFLKQIVFLSLFGLLVSSCFSAYGGAPKLKVLIIDGQNNHNWEETTPLIKEILEKSGRFYVELTTTPPKLPKKPDIKDEDKKDPLKFTEWKKEFKMWEEEVEKMKALNEEGWKNWKPDFFDYDVIVSNYNGESWPLEIEKQFEEYMKLGGGLVVIHAADNSFSDWDEYNKMIGVGGWGGRSEKSGPMLRYRNNKWVPDLTPGKGGMHGARVSTDVINLMPEHPIMKGLPQKWMHPTDEIYAQMRGPAENITVLASSFSDKKDRGTGEFEPTLMLIDYHKGRVFHTLYGHSIEPMQGLGFQITLQRGAEWAATNEVTIPVPKKSLTGPVAVLADPYFADEEFTSLFNGKNLDGWTSLIRKEDDKELKKQVFSVEDGMLHFFKGVPPGFDSDAEPMDRRSFGAVFTERKYTNYIFRFEYKWGTKSVNTPQELNLNSGCFYHVQEPKIWPKAIECQVQYNHKTNQSNVGAVLRGGNTYTVYGANEESNGFLSPEKGGIAIEGRLKGFSPAPVETTAEQALGWNQVEIIVMGDHFAIHKLNNEVVNFITNISISDGHIGLQAEFAEVFYRNMRIKEFEEALKLESFINF